MNIIWETDSNLIESKYPALKCISAVAKPNPALKFGEILTFEEGAASFWESW